MLVRIIIPVSVILSISYASMFDNLINDDYANRIYPQNQNPEIYDLSEKLFENLRALSQKIEDIEKKIPDKIEKYISGKLESLEKYMSQKLSALEQIIVDKTDISVVHQKLDALAIQVKQHNIDKNINNAICEINVQKLNVIETELSQLNNNTYLEFEELGQKVMELKRSFSKRWTAPENFKPDTEINGGPLQQIAAETLVNNFNPDLDAVTKRILDKSRDELKKYDFLKSTTPKITKELDEEKMGSPQDLWNCKTRVIRGYDFKPISLDTETPLKHVTLETDSDGLKHFEMDFAIKSDGMVMIPLSSVLNPGTSDEYFAIGVGDGHAYSWIRMVKPITDNGDSVYLGELLTYAATRNILSPTTFKEFYINISNYTLEFGERGSDSDAPILSYTDNRFDTIKYIGFTSWGDYYDAEYIYDCPINIEEMTTVQKDTEEESSISTPFGSESLIEGTEVNTEEDLCTSTPSELENTTPNLEVTSLMKDMKKESFDGTPSKSDSFKASAEENTEEDLSNSSTPSELEKTTPDLYLNYELSSYEEYLDDYYESLKTEKFKKQT